MELNSVVERDEAHRNTNQLAFSHTLTTFAVATGMVGVCLTAIGVVQLVEHNAGLETLCDELLAGDALLFLIGAICSFVSARLRFTGPWKQFQLAGDLLLMAALTVMVFSCGVLVVHM